MSIFSKFIWDVCVPSGGYAFDTNLGAAVTVPEGTYTPHELGQELEDQLTAAALGVNWTVEISSIGIVTISADGAWTVTWAGTDDDFSALLGFDESEAVVSNVLTASSQHIGGYYPGLLSWGYNVNRGTGTTDARIWEPEYNMIRMLAGSNAATAIGPATPSESMSLNFGQITVEEAANTTIGLRAFQDACVATDFLFYPDRVDGEVGDIGTQDEDYYLCTFVQNGEPRIRRGRSPNIVTFSMTLNREPAP